MTNETAKQKLARYEHVIGAQMAEITKLREENERLKKGSSAHGVLQSIYSDETQPTGHRIKAAIGAIDRETPRLTPQPPPIDLVPEPSPPIAELVHQQRTRMVSILALSLEERSALIEGVSRNDGNGTDDSDH